MTRRSKREKTRFETFQKEFAMFHHPGSLEKMDKRFPLPKLYTQRKKAIVNHLGGDKASVIEAGNLAFHWIMVEAYQAHFFKLAMNAEDGRLPQIPSRLMAQYSTFANQLGRNIANIGMRPREIEKALILEEHLARP